MADEGGRFLLSTSDDGSLRVWNMITLWCEATLECKKANFMCALKNSVLVTDGEKIVLWNAGPGDDCGKFKAWQLDLARKPSAEERLRRCLRDRFLPRSERPDIFSDWKIYERPYELETGQNSSEQPQEHPRVTLMNMVGYQQNFSQFHNFHPSKEGTMELEQEPTSLYVSPLKAACAETIKALTIMQNVEDPDAGRRPGPDPDSCTTGQQDKETVPSYVIHQQGNCFDGEQVRGCAEESSDTNSNFYLTTRRENRLLGGNECPPLTQQSDGDVYHGAIEGACLKKAVSTKTFPYAFDRRQVLDWNPEAGLILYQQQSDYEEILPAILADQKQAKLGRCKLDDSIRISNFLAEKVAENVIVEVYARSLDKEMHTEDSNMNQEDDCSDALMQTGNRGQDSGLLASSVLYQPSQLHDDTDTCSPEIEKPCNPSDQPCPTQKIPGFPLGDDPCCVGSITRNTKENNGQVDLHEANLDGSSRNVSMSIQKDKEECLQGVPTDLKGPVFNTWANTCLWEKGQGRLGASDMPPGSEVKCSSVESHEQDLQETHTAPIGKEQLHVKSNAKVPPDTSFNSKSISRTDTEVVALVELILDEDFFSFDPKAFVKALSFEAGVPKEKLEVDSIFQGSVIIIIRTTKEIAKLLELLFNEDRLYLGGRLSSLELILPAAPEVEEAMDADDIAANNKLDQAFMEDFNQQSLKKTSVLRELNEYFRNEIPEYSLKLEEEGCANQMEQAGGVLHFSTSCECTIDEQPEKPATIVEMVLCSASSFLPEVLQQGHSQASIQQSSDVEAHPDRGKSRNSDVDIKIVVGSTFGSFLFKCGIPFLFPQVSLREQQKEAGPLLSSQRISMCPTLKKGI